MSAIARISPSADLASVRLHGLDRTQKTAGFYRRVEDPVEVRRLKARAHAAFLSHEAARALGDEALAEAAAERFRAATDQLAPDVARIRSRMGVAA